MHLHLRGGWIPRNERVGKLWMMTPLSFSPLDSPRAFLLSVGATNIDGSPMVPNLNSYAAVGAAAMLGGCRRRLLSVSVIVMEASVTLSPSLYISHLLLPLSSRPQTA